MQKILIPEPGSLPAPDGGPREPGVVGPPPPIVGGAIPQHFLSRRPPRHRLVTPGQKFRDRKQQTLEKAAKITLSGRLNVQGENTKNKQRIFKNQT